MLAGDGGRRVSVGVGVWRVELGGAVHGWPAEPRACKQAVNVIVLVVGALATGPQHRARVQFGREPLRLDERSFAAGPLFGRPERRQDVAAAGNAEVAVGQQEAPAERVPPTFVVVAFATGHQQTRPRQQVDEVADVADH